MKSRQPAHERKHQATVELMSDKVYAAATREMAVRDGVAKVTLSRQFANKKSLFAEVLRSFSSIPALPEPEQRIIPTALHERRCGKRQQKASSSKSRSKIINQHQKETVCNEC